MVLVIINALIALNLENLAQLFKFDSMSILVFRCNRRQETGLIPSYSGALARSARSGAPWVRKMW